MDTILKIKHCSNVRDCIAPVSGKKDHYDVASLKIRTAEHSVSKIGEVSQPVRT